MVRKKEAGAEIRSLDFLSVVKSITTEPLSKQRSPLIIVVI